MSDNREPEVTGAPSADARSVEAVAEAVAGAHFWPLTAGLWIPLCIIGLCKVSRKHIYLRADVTDYNSFDSVT